MFLAERGGGVISNEGKEFDVSDSYRSARVRRVDISSDTPWIVTNK